MYKSLRQPLLLRCNNYFLTGLFFLAISGNIYADVSTNSNPDFEVNSKLNNDSNTATVPSLPLRSKKPLWEAGVGIGGIFLPDYRGSNEHRAIVSPVPYFVYRGDKLKVDRRGVRTLMYESGNFEVNISADVGIPVDSEKNTARAGMPDLDAAFLLGPSIDYTLFDNENGILTLKLPLQYVIATDFRDVHTEGWFSYPHINYRNNDNGALGIAVGPTFATGEFHNYYFGVNNQFATLERPEYRATAGYSGLRISTVYNIRIADYWIGTFIRYENYRNAVIDDSPLVKQNYSIMIGTGFSWVFLDSNKK